MKTIRKGLALVCFSWVWVPIPLVAAPMLPKSIVLTVSLPAASVSDLFERANEIRFEIRTSRLELSSYPYLEQLAKQLVIESNVKLEIGVHVASSGNAKRDLAFSQNRSEAIKKELINRGVSAHRLLPKGYGSDHPVAPNLTRTGRKRNERVEIHRLAN